MSVIQVDKLTKMYGKNRGVLDVCFSVEEGEIFGFIGPNGAGKSTTIRTLLNFIFPTSGSASIFGKDCVKDSSIIKRDIGYVPSEVRFYDELRVKTLLDYAASFFTDVDEKRRQELCSTFELDLDKKVGELSLGNKKKVAVVKALLTKPRLLILDEPTSGLDPLMQIKLLDVLTKEAQEGMTVFLSSHNLAEVQRVCQRVAIIREGRIVSIQKLDDVIGKNTRVIKVRSSENLTSVLLGIGAKKTDALGNGHMHFIYEGSMDRLVKTLSAHTIDDLQIEEISLEDTFMRYYGSEEAKS